LPFNRVVELNDWTTEQVLKTGNLLWTPEPDQIDRIRTEEMQTQSLFVVVPRNIYEQINGFDEKFVGWGGEDNAFYHAAKIVGGDVLRMEGDVFHLWHKPASRAHQTENGMRYRVYMQTKNREELKWIQNR